MEGKTYFFKRGNGFLLDWGVLRDEVVVSPS
jgi:hypothetical protein